MGRLNFAIVMPFASRAPGFSQEASKPPTGQQVDGPLRRARISPPAIDSAGSRTALAGRSDRECHHAGMDYLCDLGCAQAAASGMAPA